jgi:hypothetical protein
MANNIKNYLGKLTGWNNTTMNILGRDVIGIDEFEYDDNTKKENAYGAGSMPIGWTEGNYESKFSLSLYVEEENAIQAMLPPGKRLQDVAPFDSVGQYVNPNTGKIVTDIIHNCQFTGRSKKGKNGEGKMVNKHEMLISHITWGS